MLAFRLTADQAEMFFDICRELKADTEEKRVAVLQAMTQYGQVESIVKTGMSKDEYTKHLAKTFGNVLVVKSDKEIHNG